jgi:hypothetical protein
MKKNLLIALLRKYRNGAHYEIMVIFRDLLMIPAIAAVLGTMLQEFIDLVVEEGRLIEQLRKNDFTAMIKEADMEDDKTVVGFTAVVFGLMHSSNIKYVEPAKRVYNRLKAHGKIPRKSYYEELASLTLLLAELKGEYAADIATLLLGEWVTQLENCIFTFSNLLSQRDQQLALKPEGKVYDIREKVDVAYHKIVTFINASNVIPASYDFTDIITLFNIKIAYFNEAASHVVRKDIKHADAEPIATQTFTGKRICPIPRLFDEGKELNFSIDFTVTYSDNIEPGTAHIIVHGKSAYKGKCDITFNIARTV